MMLLTTARRLDWSGWALGIMGALISGGAAAIAGMSGPMVMDRKDWNLTTSLGHTLEAMLISFIVCGAISLGKFLQTHPVPDQVPVTGAQQVPPAGPAK